MYKSAAASGGGGSNSSVQYLYDDDVHLIGDYHNLGSVIQETVYLDDQPVAVIKPGISATTYKAFYVYADNLNTPRLIASH